jgi:hypothetical protein
MILSEDKKVIQVVIGTKASGISIEEPEDRNLHKNIDRAWENMLVMALLKEAPTFPWTSPVYLRIVYRFSRPKKHFIWDRPMSEISGTDTWVCCGVAKNAPPFEMMLNISKLDRTVCRILKKACIIENEGQVVSVNSRKTWAEWNSVWVRVSLEERLLYGSLVETRVEGAQEGKK